MQLLNQKLDLILEKLECLTSFKSEIENMKADILKQSRAQEEAVRRLAGNFEYLLNSQQEMEHNIANIEKYGKIFTDKIENLENNFTTLIAKSNKAVETQTDLQENDNCEDHETRMYDQVENEVQKEGPVEKLATEEENMPTQSSVPLNEAAQSDAKCSVKEKRKELFYKCLNSNCRSKFPRKISLRKDGVSYRCINPECGVFNVIGSLQDGHKWMYITCHDDCHYQQFPVQVRDGVTRKCQVCGRHGVVRDRNKMVALVEEKEERPVGAVDSSYKCWNSNCNFVFPKNWPLEKDGVSFLCKDPQCCQFSIVGELKEDHRWMVMYCSGEWHFQQCSRFKEEGKFTKCQVCGINGTPIGVNDRRGIPM